MKSSVLVGKRNIDLKFSYFGLERYYVDGKLIDKRWNFKASGNREFLVDSDIVRVDINMLPSKYSCKLYVNNELHIEDLFPELRKKIERIKSDGVTPHWFKSLVIMLIIAAILLTIISYLRDL